MSLSPKPTIKDQNHLLDQWFQSIQTWLGPQGQSGSTTNRPTNGLYVGLKYFDTTLGIPVFVSVVGPPATWVNASGATV